MSKHKATRPPTNLKWWSRYLIHIATTLLIKATRKATQRNKQQNKRKPKN